MLAGAKPNVLVFKKLLGSKVDVSFDGLPGKFEPTISGLGIISSSGLSDTPGPNLNLVKSCWSINVVNLREVFFSFKI